MTPAAISAGDLRERVGFYSRVSLDDGYGNTQAGYDSIPEFILSANIKPRLGGEQVLAARLTGTNFDNITVRYSSLSAQVDTDWVCKNERTGVVYNIRSIINPDQKKQFIELLCEKGVAVGFMATDGGLDFGYHDQSALIALFEDI
jgi:phage head-tail adaptor, putative, SPP1 family